MSSSKELGCGSLLIGFAVAFVIFLIFPPSFLVSIPLIGGLLFKGLFKATMKGVAHGVEEYKSKK